MYLLTGATGLLGSQLCDMLSELGQTCAISRSGNVLPKVQVVQGDIRLGIPDNMPFQGGTVIHCAAEIRSSNWSDHWTTNVVGTKNLLEYAVQNSACRFILLSTGGVYGPSFNGELALESQVPHPQGAYAHSKHLAEMLCHTYKDLFSLDIVIFRLYFPYSATQKSGIFSNIIESIINRVPVRINNKGAPRMTPTSLVDTVEAVRCALTVEFPAGVYNLCGDEVLSFHEIVKSIENVLGIEAVVYFTQQDAPDFMASNEKLKSFGWFPRLNFANYLSDLSTRINSHNLRIS